MRLSNICHSVDLPLHHESCPIWSEEQAVSHMCLPSFELSFLRVSSQISTGMCDYLVRLVCTTVASQRNLGLALGLELFQAGSCFRPISTLVVARSWKEGAPLCAPADAATAPRHRALPVNASSATGTNSTRCWFEAKTYRKAKLQLYVRSTTKARCDTRTTSNTISLRLNVTVQKVYGSKPWEDGCVRSLEALRS